MQALRRALYLLRLSSTHADAFSAAQDGVRMEKSRLSFYHPVESDTNSE